MPSTAFVGAELDAESIDAAARALRNSGLTLAEAIRIMIAKTARDMRLPFDAEAALEEEYGLPNTLTAETRGGRTLSRKGC